MYFNYKWDLKEQYNKLEEVNAQVSEVQEFQMENTKRINSTTISMNNYIITNQYL